MVMVMVTTIAMAMAMAMGMPVAKAKAKILATGRKGYAIYFGKPILDSIARLEHPTMAMGEAGLN